MCRELGSRGLKQSAQVSPAFRKTVGELKTAVSLETLHPDAPADIPLDQPFQKVGRRVGGWQTKDITVLSQRDFQKQMYDRLLLTGTADAVFLRIFHQGLPIRHILYYTLAYEGYGFLSFTSLFSRVKKQD